MARSYFLRAVKFVHRNVFRNTHFFLLYAIRYLDPSFRLYPHFYTANELASCVAEGKSLIRIGDGEVHVMNYGSIHYQQYDPRLREFLLKIVREYSADSPYVIGIPQEYLHQTNAALRAKNLLHCWLPFKVTFKLRFNPIASYFDAHLFYRNHGFGQTIETALEGKRILIITNTTNWEILVENGIKDRYSVTHIPCQKENSFDSFDSLLASVHQHIVSGKEKEYRVLISAGPASKALVYALSMQGISAYDLGRGVEGIYRPGSLDQYI